jgi:integrase
LVVDFPELFATPSELKTPRVHKGVHRRVLRMVSLKRNSNGSWSARKRIPDDVCEEYAALYGQRLEAKFFAPVGTTTPMAKQQFSEWLAETEGRISAIRAKRNGEGIALTPRQARALAGEWYEWFVARHPISDRQKWEALRDELHDAERETVGEAEWEQSDPDELWREDEDFRKAMRPAFADAGETAQFLAMKGLVLSSEARDRFLDWLYEDLSAALRRLIRNARGDFRNDGYSERFPRFEGADNGETPQQLFEKWVAEKSPALSTVESWRYVFIPMTAQFKERSAASITPDEAQEWIKGLVGPKRSPRTVDNTYIAASKTVFGWATDHRHIPRNPFAAVKVTIPKTIKLRETQAFHADERRKILKATLAIANTDTPDNAARRWVPWLCAYTGARPGEITQLRGSDVVSLEGIPALRITPDAGSVKGRKARVVPLHEHLVAQGFLKFLAEHGAGPLFYKPARHPDDGAPTKRKKPRPVQARQRLGDWVRSLGVSDKELSPNHAWRHTFKQIADRAGITERTSNYITGHSHKSIGAGYGAPTLGDMAEALKKFPRYED